AAANKLVMDDKVKFVIGPNGFFGKGSSPTFEANKVLHVSGYNTLQPGEIDSGTPYGFVGYNNPTAMTIVAFKAMKKEFPNVKSTALISADDGAIPYVIPKAKKALEDLGFKVIGDVIKFPNELEDFSPIAAKANAITAADSIRIEMAAPPADANILKGLRALGNQKPFVCNAYAPEILAMAGKEASNNAIINSTYTANQPGTPPLVDEVFNRGKAPRPFFGMSPNALWMLAKVIQAANSLDPAVVKAKWESMDTVDTLYGKGTLCGDETYGLHHHAVTHPSTYAKLMNGQVVLGNWIDPGPIP
ncbi:MAG TPA: ABC transporter substrate-binding protein, partial [Dehalococcoidia bacterium]|nr:ABC transporter substrate-binding protein [Dehalococcoidia bacterium]